jgi:hypothetical protein
MAAKRTLAKPAGKPRQSKSATLLEDLCRKKDQAFYDEHRELVRLRFAAYKPHIEHAQSISASSRSAVKKTREPRATRLGASAPGLSYANQSE